MELNPWRKHVAAYQMTHPGLSYKKVLIQASKTYEKGAAPKKASNTTVPSKHTQMQMNIKDVIDTWSVTIVSKKMDDMKRLLTFTVKPKADNVYNPPGSKPLKAEDKYLPRILKEYKENLGRELKLDFIDDGQDSAPWRLVNARIVGNNIEITLKCLVPGTMTTIIPGYRRTTGFNSWILGIAGLKGGNFYNNYPVKFPVNLQVHDLKSGSIVKYPNGDLHFA